MTTSEMEKRLAVLEAEVASLKSKRTSTGRWWDRIAGVFKDNPLFDEAMRNAHQSPKPLPPNGRSSRKRSASKRRSAK